MPNPRGKKHHIINSLNHQSVNYFGVIKLLEYHVGGHMNRLCRVLVLLCSALFIGAGVASADTLEFTLTGPVAAVFDMSVNSSGVLNLPFTFVTGEGFVVTPTNLMVNGVSSGDFLAFYNPGVGGGFGIFASGTDMVSYASGPQIYGGTEGSPTFASGAFILNNGAVVPAVSGAYDLTIKDLSAVAAPEPSVTILLIIGLLAVGLTVLRFKPGFVVNVG
jgi:hypothetical protein